MTDRRLDKHVELDASPEEVWTAIATGPGMATWFVPHEVEPREGGAVAGRFGGAFTSSGAVAVTS